MFRYACARIGKYTRPIVISWVTTSGTRASRVGAYVLINSSGHIATAAHILDFIKQLENSRDANRSGASGANGNGGTSNGGGLQAEWWGKTATIAPNEIQDFSVWWGADGVTLREARIDPVADAAIGLLEPAITENMTDWPELRDGKEPDEPGASLCKLGFPFHHIVPAYDDATGSFSLPPGSVPLPFFPIEGIYCRTLEVADRENKSLKARFIETSTPSPPGHMGGPLFDAEGRIWGIQSHTAHYALDFCPTAPSQPEGPGVEQFLNASRACHISSIQHLLDEVEAEYRVAKSHPTIN